MDLINIVLSLFAGITLLLNAFSKKFQEASLPAPLLALLAGILIGPYALGLLNIEEFGIESHTLLEQASRITLGVGLTGVALRLPQGYWRKNWKWVASIIGIGMVIMFVVATGVLWALLGLPFLTALLLGSIITPVDPIVTTPIVTGSVAENNVPDRVRYNLSGESGLNDGLAYLFVFLPILLITKSVGEAWTHLAGQVFLKEIIGSVLLGVALGYLTAKLFNHVKGKSLIEETSYLGFLLPFSLLVLGFSKLMGTNGILAIFISGAVFGQMIPRHDESMQAKEEDTINRFFIIPVFVLLGLALPFSEWGKLGFGVALALLVALVVRRIAAVWLTRPLYKDLHNNPETSFMSWFGAIGVSALYYATLAVKETGKTEVLVYITLAITISIILHGLTSMPFSKKLHQKLKRRQA